ncbi:MAG: glycosyltransferase family 4 protein [Planctomycetota bacterium]
MWINQFPNAVYANRARIVLSNWQSTAFLGQHSKTTMALDIAIVRQSYRDDGGAERFVSRMIDALSQSDLTTTLVARSWNQTERLPDQTRFVAANPPFLGRLTRAAGFSIAARRRVSERQFDLVQTNERIPGFDVYRAGDGTHAEWLRLKAQTQTAAARFGTLINPFHIYTKFIEKRVIEHPSLKAIICNSEMVRDQIQRDFEIEPSKCHVIYNSVDTDHFHPKLSKYRERVRSEFGIPLFALLLVQVGSGFERKGVATSIKAVATNQNTHLLVVGKCSRTQRYQKMASDLSCGDRVHFAGVQADVRPFYGAADASILPTIYDPFPNVILEAMSCGLPIISSTTCGCVDIIESGMNGFVCDYRDTRAFADAIDKVSQTELRKQMGDNARSLMMEFTANRMQQSLRDLYQSILSLNSN